MNQDFIKELSSFLFSELELELNQVCYGDIDKFTSQQIADKFGKFKFVVTAERDLEDPDTVSTVLYFEEQGSKGTYVLLTGYYSSWDGTFWKKDSLKIVKPVTKTYVSWEEV